jgi:hypothetical protein
LHKKDSYIEVSERVEAAAPRATAIAIDTAGTATQKKKKKKKKSTQGHAQGHPGKSEHSKTKSMQHGTAQPPLGDASPTYRPIYSTLAPKGQRVGNADVEDGGEAFGDFAEEAEGLYLEPGVNAF